MPDLQTLILGAGLCAFLAAAVTQVGRSALAGRPRTARRWLLRLLSLVSGCAWGVALVGGWWGAAAGVAGGVAASAVVAAVKAKVKAWGTAP